MTNILELKPNIIIGDRYVGGLTLNSWKGFQSRQGNYGSKDNQEASDGKVKVYVRGREVDYVKTTTQEQINAINYLVNNSNKVRDSLLMGLLLELPNLKETYEELIPPIDKIEDFKNVIGLSNLHVMPADKDDFAYIGFELGCDWDDEHGVGVMMHKDRVVSIGLAEIAFDSWITFDDNETTSIETQKWHEANARIQSARQKKPWWKFW